MNLQEGCLFDFPEFLCVYAKNFNKEVNHEQELINAFKVFDKSREGVINAEELMHHLTRMGEKFTDEQVKEISGIFDSNLQDQNRINYSLISKIITRTAKMEI
jgi:calmodulin